MIVKDGQFSADIYIFFLKKFEIQITLFVLLLSIFNTALLDKFIKFTIAYN